MSAVLFGVAEAGARLEFSCTLEITGPVFLGCTQGLVLALYLVSNPASSRGRGKDDNYPPALAVGMERMFLTPTFSWGSACPGERGCLVSPEHTAAFIFSLLLTPMSFVPEETATEML